MIELPFKVTVDLGTDKELGFCFDPSLTLNSAKKILPFSCNKSDNYQQEEDEIHPLTLTHYMTEIRDLTMRKL